MNKENDRFVYEVYGWKRMYQNEDTIEKFCRHFDTEEEVKQFEKELKDWAIKLGGGSHVEAQVFIIDLNRRPPYPINEFNQSCW